MFVRLMITFLMSTLVCSMYSLQEQKDKDRVERRMKNLDASSKLTRAVETYCYALQTGAAKPLLELLRDEVKTTSQNVPNIQSSSDDFGMSSRSVASIKLSEFDNELYSKITAAATPTCE
ncbi:MAG: hypothetical protein LBB21_01190 [Holosporaceae bacterium]|jgi:transposase-like protein|nr:hypothetical protein [Holosporaceae bacterium]